MPVSLDAALSIVHHTSYYDRNINKPIAKGTLLPGLPWAVKSPRAEQRPGRKAAPHYEPSAKFKWVDIRLRAGSSREEQRSAAVLSDRAVVSRKD